MTIYNKYDIRKTRYTHRDYNSIKDDLISVIPSLTQEWTGREEADPGIVLIKLMAMFGDTLSYNVDKIAHELYIQSVTQKKNCAKILALLGYKMHWYRSARVMVNVRLNTIYDSSFNLVHALVSPYKATFVTKDGGPPYCVANQGQGLEQIDIYSSTYTTPIKLVQGSPCKVTFHGRDLYNNRYYFSNYNVDEDELFMTVSAAGRKVECKLTKSLTLQTDSSAIYFEFNIDDYDRPYVQLDESWEDLVNSEDPEFTLYYVSTVGSAGNIGYDGFERINNTDQGTNASSNNIVISNLPNTEIVGSDRIKLSTYNRPGKDPQSVEEAKKDSSNYVFTHDTLVTSSDYEKAVKRLDGVTVSKLVDVQVIYNDHLDLKDICSRGIDKFSGKVVGLISGNIDYSNNLSRSATLSFEEGSSSVIVNPKYGDYVKVKFNKDINDFVKGYEIYDNDASTVTIVPIVCFLKISNDVTESTYPVNKLFGEDVSKDKEYVIRFNPLKVGYPYKEEYLPEDTITTYNGRWDLADDAESVIKDHTNIDHHMVILYVGYLNFNPDYNLYYNSTFDETVKSHYKLYGSDPYGMDYNKGTEEHPNNLDENGNTINYIISGPLKENNVDTGNYGCGYYPYKIAGNIQYAIKDLINNLHVVTNNVEFGTIKLFPFKVKGILHLIEPFSPSDVKDILNRVNDNLKYEYYPDRHNIGEKPNFIELVDIIQSSDPRIKYFDATERIVEWAPAIQTDPDKPNYIDKIFDTTSAIMYNGLSDQFVLDKKFFTFRLKNEESDINYLYSANNLIGVDDFRITTQDAYLLNYYRECTGNVTVDDANVVPKIPYGQYKDITVRNYKELEALVNDINHSDILHTYKMDGDTQVIDKTIKFSNNGLRWVKQ